MNKFVKCNGDDDTILDHGGCSQNSKDAIELYCSELNLVRRKDFTWDLFIPY
jgi:hypothetical protein